MTTLAIIAGVFVAWLILDVAVMAWLLWMANRTDRRRPLA